MASPSPVVKHLPVYQLPQSSNLSCNYTHPLGDLIQSQGFKHHLTLQEINCKGKKERKEEPIYFTRRINQLQEWTTFESRVKETNSKIYMNNA